MYLHWGFSVALLVGVFAIYWFVIRPKAPILETRTYIRSFWQRWWERLLAYRTWFATFIAAALAALPDIAVAILPLDLSWLVGPNWTKVIAGGLALFLAVNGALKTRPGNEKV